MMDSKAFVSVYLDSSKWRRSATLDGPRLFLRSNAATMMEKKCSSILLLLSSLLLLVAFLISRRVQYILYFDGSPQSMLAFQNLKLF